MPRTASNVPAALAGSAVDAANCAEGAGDPGAICGECPELGRTTRLRGRCSSSGRSAQFPASGAAESAVDAANCVERAGCAAEAAVDAVKCVERPATVVESAVDAAKCAERPATVAEPAVDAANCAERATDPPATPPRPAPKAAHCAESRELRRMPRTAPNPSATRRSEPVDQLRGQAGVRRRGQRQKALLRSIPDVEPAHELRKLGRSDPPAPREVLQQRVRVADP